MIHNVFHVSLLEQDITKKERVEKVPKLDAGDDSKKYKLEAIRNSAVHAMKLESGHLPRLYYLVAWKSYPKEENTWKPFLAIQHLKKLISLLYKDHFEKPTASSLPVNSVPPMARLTIKLMAKFTPKQKRGRLAKSDNKWAKKNWTFCLFPYITSPWPNQVTFLLGFHRETSVFLLKLFNWVRRFFIVSSLSNNFFHCWFSLLSSYWVKRFFY